MPTFDVTINVNVPGLGNRNVVQTGVVAPSMEAAIALVKTLVVLTPITITQTAP
jgi:hypothetical protein